jgi:hypothetical protein
MADAERAGLWQYGGFRRAFRNLTAVWGLAYLMEAVALIVIVEYATVGDAVAITKVMPLAVTAALAAWTVAYSLYQKRKGARLAAASQRGEVA